MFGDIAGGSGDQVDMSAEQCGDRLGRALERDHLEASHVRANGLREQTGRDVVMAADRGGESDADRLGIFFQPLGELAPAFERRIRPHCEYHVIVEQRRNRREIGVVERARADDVVGQYRRCADHDIVRVTRVLDEVIHRHHVAAAGLVHHRQRRPREQPFFLDDALDGARGLVVAAAGRRWHHDLDVAVGFPRRLRLTLRSGTSKNESQ